MSAFSLLISLLHLTMKRLRFTERSATFEISAAFSPFRTKGEKAAEISNRRFGEFLELRYILGATRHRPVSYYAFLKGWLLPSLPPGCLGLGTSFATQKML